MRPTPCWQYFRRSATILFFSIFYRTPVYAVSEGLKLLDCLTGKKEGRGVRAQEDEQLRAGVQALPGI
jgi:hypothetical protein